ncbi:hypothetical protein [Curtobacterium sp. MCJR17_043]|nr:hypothetical protein [Curtobacterium sp. MCJR17_043]WIB35856.1 hypothetical protein DEJ15_00530 [Curtobacterium sp. MCJR17_043]
MVAVSAASLGAATRRPAATEGEEPATGGQEGERSREAAPRSPRR